MASTSIQRGKVYRAALASTCHDISAGNERGFDLMVCSLIPLQQLLQPTIACETSQGVQGTQEVSVALLLREAPGASKDRRCAWQQGLQLKAAHSLPALLA